MVFTPGVGGQVDFIRGAALGLDGQGKPILAMPSVTSRGESKIVPFIKKGNQIRVSVVTSSSLIYSFFCDFLLLWCVC